MNKTAGFFRRIKERAVSLLFPPTCPLCREVSDAGPFGSLCSECVKVYRDELVHLCPKCKGGTKECTCVPDFSKSGVSVVKLTFFAFYTGYSRDSAVAKLIYSMKRVPDGAVHMFMARQMALSISRTLAEFSEITGEVVVTYIPRSGSSLKKYGFDQMEEISRRVAEFLGCRVEKMFLRKGGIEQKALDAAKRRENVENALSLRKNPTICGKRVVLLDDVVTTGATMRAAVDLLATHRPAMIIPAAAFFARTDKRPLLGAKDPYK